MCLCFAFKRGTRQRSYSVNKHIQKTHAFHCCSYINAAFIIILRCQDVTLSLMVSNVFSEMAQRVAVNDGAAGSKRTSRVRVAVRLRPYMDTQDEKGEGPCVRGLGPQKLEIINWRNATETLQYQSVRILKSLLF